MSDLESAFSGFQVERRPNAAAIQVMALENYVEMRDQVAGAEFLLQRELERILSDRHPGRFIPRYSMVSFTRLPYAIARERGAVQRRILVEATAGKTKIEQVDLAEVDSLVRERLDLLTVELI